jgi:hypothetical protein
MVNTENVIINRKYLITIEKDLQTYRIEIAQRIEPYHVLIFKSFDQIQNVKSLSEEEIADIMKIIHTWLFYI